ncbi:class I SAM-dependent methyltransferase [bacterium]|nr:class I SAM-dependent methyltransferase [bacterium]
MGKKDIENHYDAISDKYHEQYEKQNLKTLGFYPANYFRLRLVVNSFISKNVGRVLDVGVGEGTPLVTLAKTGIEGWGFDISHEMVERAKENMRKEGLDPGHIFRADIQDPVSYAYCLRGGLFDGLMALGVMPHVEHDEEVLKNMAVCLKPGGTILVEFRNKFFSLFTFNRLTLSFILDDLLRDVDPRMKELVRAEIEPKLRMDQPPVRSRVEESRRPDAPGYDAILSRFHNPFEVQNLFKKTGFRDIRLLWYHYHPAMPFLETVDPGLFRQEGFRLEQESSDWRGLFLCSAFVVEAVKS